MNSPRDPCAGCVYQTLVGGYLICDYISITGHRRPCPFGAGCIVKQTKEGEPVSKRWDVETALKLYEEGKTDPEIAEWSWAAAGSGCGRPAWNRRPGSCGGCAYVLRP